MTTPLPETLPAASLLLAALFFFGSGQVLAQESRSADSLKASSKQRVERGRDASRNVDSRRTRSDRSNANRRSTRTRRTEPDRTATQGRAATPGRATTTGRATERGRGDGSRGATRREDRDARATQGTDRRRDSDGARRIRGDDRRRTRDDDRRVDRDDERRRNHDRRTDRDYDRRDDDHVRINRHPYGSAWGRPRIDIDIHWPWVHRHQRRWSPRYRYRQVVYVDAGWGRHHRESRLDLRTYYRHRVREASHRSAVVDIFIDRIEIYEDGFFVGEVNHIPSELSRMRAVVDRRRGIRFDRDVFLLGDPYAGFEIVSTRHYDGFVLNDYRAAHGVRVGALDLRRERIVPVRRSRFFDPRDFSGYVPINLLPEDAAWLVDYGYDSYSGHYWGDDDRYYYGFSGVDDYARYDREGVYYNQVEPREETSGRESSYYEEAERERMSRRDENARSSRITPERQALEKENERTFETENGAKIRLKRESSIERVD